MNYQKLKIENELQTNGYKYISGIDETGMCDLACGFVVGALILDLSKPYIKEINDSKKLSKNKRLQLEPTIKERAIAYSLIYVPTAEINKAYVEAGGKSGSFRRLHLEAMKKAILSLKVKPDMVIVDHYVIPSLDIPQRAIQGGDELSASIAGASILAKCERERIVEKIAENYPNFNHWKTTYGNWTPREVVALHKFGATPEHRLDFIETTLNYKAGKITKKNNELIMKQCPKKKCNQNTLCEYIKCANEYRLKVRCPNDK